MCLARVKLLEGRRGESELMGDVARIEPTENGLVVTGLMGETRTIEGTLRSIDFMESVVVVEQRED